MHLVQANSGAYLFSTHFDKTHKDAVAIQRQISEQVAAATRLSLIHKNPHYSSALAKLGHLGVEQLVIAHKQLSKPTEVSIKQALGSLHSLNQRFSDTPEIIGLLAWGHRALTYTSTDNTNDSQQTSVRLAKQALLLDPTNFDALKTLYYEYITVAGLREQAYYISETMLNNHRDRKSAYRASLNLMLKASTPCPQIQAFVADIPTGIFTKQRLTVINTILSACIQSTPLEALNLIQTKTNANTKISTAKIDKAINNNLYFFGLHHDMMFDAIKSRSRRISNQSRLSDDFWIMLLAGAFDEAKTSEKLIDDNGFWHWLVALLNTLYDITLDHKTGKFKHSEHSSFTLMINKLNILRTFAAALIVQSKQTDNPQILTDYLSSMNTFPISLINKNEAIALMMLQYHSGQVQQGQVSGKKLFDKLGIYYKEHPNSFKFWGLGNDYLIAKFHCGSQCQLPGADFENLTNMLFNADHAYWMDDIAFTRVALSPWADNPVVVEYLARIEQDRVRFREKRGL